MSKFWPDSLGIRFWKFCPNFEIPWLWLYAWVFYSENHINPTSPQNNISIKRWGIFCGSFDIHEKFVVSCPPTPMPTQKLKFIFDIQFPGNRFELGITENDFWSSIIWASSFIPWVRKYLKSGNSAYILEFVKYGRSPDFGLGHGKSINSGHFEKFGLISFSNILFTAF